MVSADTINERTQLEQAIIALEAQRPILGDAVVDTVRKNPVSTAEPNQA